MIWTSKLFYSNDCLNQNKEGQDKMIEINADQEVGTPSSVLPLLESITWKKDLYNMLWNSNLESNLSLIFDVFIEPDQHLTGNASLKI